MSDPEKETRRRKEKGTIAKRAGPVTDNFRPKELVGALKEVWARGVDRIGPKPTHPRQQPTTEVRSHIIGSSRRSDT